jgi:protein gp37
MSDLFHEDVPEEFILDVFNVMQSTPRHTYQILTKRSDRLKEIWDRLPWPANVWMGVSVENSEVKFRIDDLRNVGASTKFLSLEPLIGPLGELNLQGIDWVITGGESGPHARPMEANWVREIRDQCTASGTAFHFKQWGGVNKKSTGRVLDGRTWDELPARAA